MTVTPSEGVSLEGLAFLAVVFVGAMLILSLFTWRPWCHFFCPFGLAGWVAESVHWVMVERIDETHDRKQQQRRTALQNCKLSEVQTARPREMCGLGMGPGECVVRELGLASHQVEDT